MTCHPRGNNNNNIFCIHSVSSGIFYEGANFMINGLPEISIKYFSELASITYCLRLHNLFVKIVNTLEPKYARDQLQ